MTENLTWNKVDIHNRVANAEAMEQRLLELGFTRAQQRGLSVKYRLCTSKGTPLAEALIGLQGFLFVPLQYQGSFDWLAIGSDTVGMRGDAPQSVYVLNNAHHSLDDIGEMAAHVVHCAEILEGLGNE